MSRSAANGVTHRRTKTRFRPGYGYVECDLAPAPSAEEALVFVDLLGGGRAAALVNNADVRPSGPVRAEIKGEVVVTVLKKVTGGFLVELPNEAINSAGRVPVSENAVKFP